MAEWLCKTYAFAPENMRAYLPEGLPEEVKEAAETGMVQLLPGIHEADGFFFARLRKERSRSACAQSNG